MQYLFKKVSSMHSNIHTRNQFLPIRTFSDKNKNLHFDTFLGKTNMHFHFDSYSEIMWSICILIPNSLFSFWYCDGLRRILRVGSLVGVAEPLSIQLNKTKDNQLESFQFGSKRTFWRFFWRWYVEGGTVSCVRWDSVPIALFLKIVVWIELN